MLAARTRWKSENENNNVLKNYGYHLEHNFGHGDQYLALVLVMLNLLAFLFHTVLELCDEQYRRVRLELAVRRTFFNDLQALTRYLYFDSWPALIDFMFTRLELDVDRQLAAPPPHQAPLGPRRLASAVVSPRIERVWSSAPWPWLWPTPCQNHRHSRTAL